MLTFSYWNMIEITIYSNFHNFLLIFLFNFQWLPWNRKLWKICLAFHDFSLMFCGETLTNAPSVLESDSRYIKNLSQGLCNLGPISKATT